MTVTLEPIQRQKEERIDKLLVGAVDMHCHSGPSVMPRALTHIEAMEEAAAAGFRAMLIKDHYYSATPITELLSRSHAHLGIDLFSGVPLNNTTGGFNKYAVDHGIALGARLVWMPTFAAKNHVDADNRRKKGFPHTKMRLLEPDPLTVFDGSGALKDEVKVILDMIAEHDVILSGGHLHISEIFAVFEEAKKRGVSRLLVNHPTFIIDASVDDIAELVKMGAYIEHSLCMFIHMTGKEKAMFPPEELDKLIKVGTVDRTILASDLGQVGNDRPVQGFRAVIANCIDLGYSDEDIRKMVSGNALRLLGYEN
jgi:hypothetical protein